MPISPDLSRIYSRRPRDDPLCGSFRGLIIIERGMRMPERIKYYEPDQLDCNTLVTALGNDFGCLCDITTSYARDQVVVLVRCHKGIETPGHTVLVQAIVRSPLRTARSLYTMQYSALLDCWHQLDRGLLAAATRPIEYSWSGRPKAPERRHK